MKVYIQIWRVIFPYLILLSMNKKDKTLVQEDMEMYLKYDEWRHKKTWQQFAYCMICLPSFRNVFYYRSRDNKILSPLSKLFLKPVISIKIEGDIDGGLYIPHNVAIIGPRKAGKNLHIKPGVVIGQISGGKFPRFGDNVLVGANATVIGDITIGNNVKIGAGAVVNKDIPDNCVVVGNPCQIVKRK
ncbi:MAG: serine acetyltransferase [Bacillota bacterium]|nr:serine acetyltransferase [Bacillota bacterium]